MGEALRYEIDAYVQMSWNARRTDCVTGFSTATTRAYLAGTRLPQALGWWQRFVALAGHASSA